VQPKSTPAPSANGHLAVQRWQGQADSAAPSAFEFESDSEAVAPEAERLLQQARDFIKRGQRQEAIVILQDIVLRFPLASEASVAKSTLVKAGISV